MKSNSEIKQLDDISLLEYLCDSKCEVAYEEFVTRYYKIVKEQCLFKCKQRKLDKHIGEEIAHDTFEKVKRTNSFKREKLKGSDPVKAITGWLYRILNNQFYDYHNSKKKLDAPDESYFSELAQEFAESHPDELMDLKEFAETILSKLNKKEKEVVLTDFEYKRGRKYLPPDINESLAVRIGVKPGTVRKIRERAIVKIKLAINEFNN